MTLLVPERMLVFSPALAATIGLEEAILLYQLHDLGVVRGLAQTQWCDVDIETLERLLPFWSGADLQRIAASLAAKGVAQVELSQSGAAAMQLHFCLADGQTRNEVRNAMPRSVAAPQDAGAPHDAAFGRSNPTNHRDAAHRERAATTSDNYAPRALDDGESAAPFAQRGATLLSGGWQPQEDTLQLLALKNIPRQFAIEQLEEFVLYWRERGRAEFAWDNKFRKHVIERWQRHLQNGAAVAAQAATPDAVWYPSVDALQILERTGINREFIEDTIPEFVLYWRERGDNTGTWNSKFIAHIRRQWARYSNALEHDQEPRPIAANWQPSEDVYDILRMATIDIAFACELLPEFILFWRDAGTPQRSWNTKFLQHVKYQWATRHHLTGAHRAGHSLAAGHTLAAAAPQSAFERLTDRSWATGLVEGV